MLNLTQVVYYTSLVYARVIYSINAKIFGVIFVKFNEILNNLMAEAGYSNYRLAKEVGCSQTTVANWLRGHNEPHIMMFQKIADVFGVSVEYLQGETTDRSIKKAPAPKDERIAAMEGRIAMLVDLFERLPPDDQNDVLYQLLAKAHDQLGREKRKESE